MIKVDVPLLRYQNPLCADAWFLEQQVSNQQSQIGRKRKTCICQLGSVHKLGGSDNLSNFFAQVIEQNL
jgi:hypothetical protein